MPDNLVSFQRVRAISDESMSSYNTMTDSTMAHLRLLEMLFSAARPSECVSMAVSCPYGLGDSGGVQGGRTDEPWLGISLSLAKIARYSHLGECFNEPVSSLGSTGDGPAAISLLGTPDTVVARSLARLLCPFAS